MLNTIKRDQRRVDKVLFEKFAKEQDFVEEMKKEIEKLQEEVKQNEFKIAEEDHYKDILSNLYE